MHAQFRRPGRSRRPRQRPVSINQIKDVQQRQFLLRVRDEFKRLHDAAKECNVREPQLTEWLSRRRFRRALAGARQAATRRLELEIAMGRLAAARKLTELVHSRDTMAARLASLNLVALNAISRDVMKRHKESEKERAAREAAEQEELGPRIHPDCPPEEAERIIAEAEARARARQEQEGGNEGQ